MSSGVDLTITAPKAILGYHWIDDEVLWLERLNARNETSHIYDEGRAKEIYEHIKVYYLLMKKVADLLKKKYNDNS